MSKPFNEESEIEFEEVWPMINPTILKLLRQEPISKREWQDTFWSVHSLCILCENGPKKIYNRLEMYIHEYISETKPRVLAHQDDDQALLKAYTTEWKKFCFLCNFMVKAFQQVNISLRKRTSYYSKEESKDHSFLSSSGKCDNIIYKLMLDCWNISIFSDIKYRLQKSAMKLIQEERNGAIFDSQLVISLRESYATLCSLNEDKFQTYREIFEKPYIEGTREYYRVKANQIFKANGVEEYMRYAEQKLEEEEQRASKYLHPFPGYLQSLQYCCIDILLSTFKDTFLEEYQEMLKFEKKDSLKIMFKLMDYLPDGIPPMLEYLKTYIFQTCIDNMRTSAEMILTNSEKYVERLIELFLHFYILVEEAFNNDSRFVTARESAFKKVVNDTTVFKLELQFKCKGVRFKSDPESRCPEQLAYYCDMLLRKSPLSKNLTSEETDIKLKNVWILLNYVQNKDVFMKYYQAHLIRRLILRSSADSEREESMMAWLRGAGMPAEYVNNLARMFLDIKVSEDLNQEFQSVLDGNEADSVNIRILNSSAWARRSEKVQITLPLELEDYIPKVEHFYKERHSGRKLQWCHLLSSGTITFRTDAGKFELDVTTFQMAVLFAWNERPHDKISFEDLQLATELPDFELRRTLWSLVAFPKLKHQVLLYSPYVKTSKGFVNSTLFWINQEFAIVKNRVAQNRGKINLIGRLQLSTQDSSQEDKDSIMQLRVFRTQEAIVKIMKMRKQVTSAQLETELIEILKNMFLPSRKVIKEQIEWLVEHGYMKRANDDVNVFIYVA